MVNSRVVARQRPAWSWFGSPGVRALGVPGARGYGVPAGARTGNLGVPSGGRSRAPGLGDVAPTTGARTFAALGGDLRGFGLNVPTPQTHAGRLANKAVARLMWARKPVKLRWHSPTGAEPFAWRIYAAPRARQNVLDVLRDVINEVGQGSVSTRVYQDTREGIYPDEAWYVELLPPELQEPQPGDRALGHRSAAGSAMGMPAALSWAPMRDRDFGPREWRAAGRPSIPGYAGDVAPEPAADPDPAPGPRPGGAPSSPDVLGPGGEVRRVVREIAQTMRTDGEAAGMARAERLGPRFIAGARAWVAARALTEEQLAERAAAVRARLTRARLAHPGCPSCRADEMVLLFFAERLAELRAAKATGRTPAQAVADHPDVPTTQVPRWVPYSMLALAIIGAVSALSSSSRAVA